MNIEEGCALRAVGQPFDEHALSKWGYHYGSVGSGDYTDVIGSFRHSAVVADWAGGVRVKCLLALDLFREDIGNALYEFVGKVWVHRLESHVGTIGEGL